ncbi:Nucleoid-associated protein GFO_1796 [Tenacibaculum sp. 190524A02b]|uniref:Nucleoid-associated protein T190115A13A_40048 n=1 Tax=Tenacibaculum vairaonense TaxID=3137860 RepID=A0ABM9PP63_9FLAO
MFGDISGMMGKLKEAQEKVEETKKRLDTVLIDETAANGAIKVTVTANRAIKAINVDESLLEDKEELEDYLIIALNKALKKAGEINEQELAIAAKTGMPNIPGMDLFK